MEEKELSRFSSLFHSVFGSTSYEEFFRGEKPVKQDDDTSDFANFIGDRTLKGKVQYTILSRVGHGPKNIDPTG